MAERKTGASALWSSLLMVFRVVSLLLGFVQQTIVAASFGAGRVIDMFVLAASGPSLLGRVAGQGQVRSVLVPLYVEAANGDPEARRVLAACVQLCLGLSLVCVVVGLAGARPILALLGPGFAAGETAEAARMMLPLLSLVPLGFALDIVGSRLQAERAYLPEQAGLVAAYLVFIAVLVLGVSAWGLKALIAANVAFASVVLGCAAAASGPSVLSLAWTGRWEPRVALELGRRMGPLWLIALINDGKAAVDRGFATTLGRGGLAVLNYSHKFNLLFVGVIGVSAGMVFFTDFSEHAAKKDEAGMRESFLSGMEWIAVLTFPLLAACVFSSRPIIAVLFQRGRFTADDTGRVAALLSPFALNYYLWSFGQMINQYFFATKRQAYLTAVIAAYVGLYLVLARLLIPRFQLQGIAWATLGANVPAHAALLWKIGSELRLGKSERLRRFLVRYACVAGVSLAVYVGLLRSLGGRGLPPLALLASAGTPAVAVYAAGCVWLLEDVASIARSLAAKLRSRAGGPPAVDSDQDIP